MNWKSVSIFGLTSSVALFGLKGLISDNGEVVNDSKQEALETDLFGPNPEITDSSGLGTEIGGTWAPSPVSETSTYDGGLTEEQKAKNRAEAKKIYGALNDYAFKMFLPCGNGTGWILDYEIPENGGYPTKWYIATNLHVIFDLRFSEDTYAQNTPFWGPYVKNLRSKNQERIEALKADKGKLSNKCSDSYNFGYLDINLGQQDTGAKLGANEGAIAKGQMNEPKLFYAALNFLDRKVVEEKKVPKNHFADFGVVEFEFTSEQAARDVTNNFADKYKDGHPINLLTEPLEKKYKTRKEIVDSKNNYYILAYPNGPSNEFAYTKNWDEKTSISSHFGGFASAERTSVWGKWTVKFKWLGEEYHEFGHRYSFSHNVLGAGASGGLYVDGDGNAVGVIIQGSSSINWAQPLRSFGTAEELEGVDTPPYDLISGVEGQKFSYKSQVQKYILKHGRQTWLSRQGNWTVNN